MGGGRVASPKKVAVDGLSLLVLQRIRYCQLYWQRWGIEGKVGDRGSVNYQHVTDIYSRVVSRVRSHYSQSHAANLHCRSVDLRVFLRKTVEYIP